MSRRFSLIPLFPLFFLNILECIRAIKESPISRFHFQEFNFSSYLSYKRENFFGRKWLFKELEDTFQTDRSLLGVLITGEPGSGKSALMSQLICSPFSTMLIHNNIIGYHLCDYSERGKRDGARFVRNLVDQIAGSIREYSYHVTSNEQIRRELDKRCESDPIGCFHGTILGPLRDLKTKPNSLRYILIDALDECIEKDGKTSTILDILSSKISQFPKWLKVILSTRNRTVVNTKIPRTVKRMPLNPTDERNLEDIRSYIKQFLSQHLFFKDRLLEAIGLKSTSEGSLINELSKKGEGNFLFVKTTLQYLHDSDGGTNLQYFPTSLFDTYDRFFKRHFGEDDFDRFKALFEVLLAAGSPLQLDEIDRILKLQNQTQEVSKLVEQVSSFLRFGQDGTIWIYHQSFAEWLVDQAKQAGGFSIRKSRGHQYTADYLLDSIRKRNATLTFKELSELSMHVLSGGMLEKHKQALEVLNVNETRDPQNGRCILHDLAIKDHNFPLLEVFLSKFVSADILDIEGKTPAFYAASEGNVDNLKLFIDKGIDVNYILKNFPSLDPISTIVQNRGIEDFSMVHVAAFKAHTKIVELLIKSNVSYAKPYRNEPAPLHLAAGNGHLDVVKLLYNSGAQVDVISLHHAAARNHSAVVEFLLKTAGVRDECLRCNASSLSNFSENATVQQFHISFCESALHAAVARSHHSIVKLLLSFDNSSLECRHISGKTPLMDAVGRNDTEMVELLLNEGANVETRCGNEMSGNINKLMCSIFSTYNNGFLYTVYCEKDVCGCGNKAIHLTARLGLWKIAEKLIRKRNASMYAGNCQGETALTIALDFDQGDFIYNFDRELQQRQHRSINYDAIFITAAECGLVKTLEVFANDFDFSEIVSEDNRTLLSLAIIWSRDPSNGAFFTCSQGSKDDSWTSPEKITIEIEKRMATVKFLVKSQENLSCFLNRPDKHGMTALHYAAMVGFVDGVKFLVQQGSDVSALDHEGDSPLIWATSVSPMYPDVFPGCRRTSDGVFTTCNTTSYDDTAAYLIWIQRSNIQICDSESARLLITVITNRMSLSLYSLLKIGVDKNCDVELFIRPFLYHLNIGWEQISEVFKIFEVDVSVECGVAFRGSELHLMSFSSVPDNVGNFFKPSVSNRSFPLQRLINGHPKGVRIFDECRDAEGYLPIHRAAQGGNLDAIEWFMYTGVDLLQRTLSGLTALDLSVLYLGNVPYSRMFSSLHPRLAPLTTSKYQRHTFEKLLLEFLNSTRHVRSTVLCNSTFEGLSPLHIAALRGLKVLKLVYRKARRVYPSLPLNCTNKHWIVPLYLAYFYESIKALSNKSSRLPETTDAVNDGTFLQYPEREAEYHIIYNHFYHSPVEYGDNFGEIFDATGCPGFYDLLPKRKTLIDELHCNGDCLKLSNDLLILLQYDYVSDIHFNQQMSIVKNCVRDCRCKVTKLSLQLYFTSRPRKNRRVSQFIGERMGWTDISADGDVQDRWPFYFLYKKATNAYKSYEYLKVLNRGLELIDNFYDDN